MKKITLKDFKSLISWLSADEMIDMMPASYVFQSYSSIMFAKRMNRKNVIIYHLLRLLENNYLSDYQLITLHNEEEKQVNNW